MAADDEGKHAYSQLPPGCHCCPTNEPYHIPTNNLKSAQKEVKRLKAQKTSSTSLVELIFSAIAGLTLIIIEHTKILDNFITTAMHNIDYPYAIIYSAIVLMALLFTIYTKLKRQKLNFDHAMPIVAAGVIYIVGNIQLFTSMHGHVSFHEIFMIIFLVALGEFIQNKISSKVENLKITSLANEIEKSDKATKEFLKNFDEAAKGKLEAQAKDQNGHDQLSYAGDQQWESLESGKLYPQGTKIKMSTGRGANKIDILPLPADATFNVDEDEDKSNITFENYPNIEALIKSIDKKDDNDGRKKLFKIIASRLIPFLIVTAAISGTIWGILNNNALHGINIFIANIIIACPCIILLAALTYDIFTWRASKEGIMINNHNSIDAEISKVILDYTGTITEVTAVYTKEEKEEKEEKAEEKEETEETEETEEEAKLLAIALALESKCPENGPVRDAIIKCIKEEQPNIGSMTVDESSISFIRDGDRTGVQGIIKDKEYFIGKTKSASQVTLMETEKELATFTLKHDVTQETKASLQRISENWKGIKVLSGAKITEDEKKPLKLNKDSIVGELLPQDKAVHIIQELLALKGDDKRILFCGDGYNDFRAIRAVKSALGIEEHEDYTKIIDEVRYFTPAKRAKLFKKLIVVAASPSCDLAKECDFVLQSGAKESGGQGKSAIAQLEWLLNSRKLSHKAYLNNLSFSIIYIIAALILVNGALIPWLGISFGPGAGAIMMAVSSLALGVNLFKFYLDISKEKSNKKQKSDPKDKLRRFILDWTIAPIWLASISLIGIGITLGLDQNISIIQNLSNFGDFSNWHLSTKLLLMGAIFTVTTLFIGFILNLIPAINDKGKDIILNVMTWARNRLLALTKPINLLIISSTIFSCGIISSLLSHSNILIFFQYPSQFDLHPIGGRLLIVGMVGMAGIISCIVLHFMVKKLLSYNKLTNLLEDGEQQGEPVTYTADARSSCGHGKHQGEPVTYNADSWLNRKSNILKQPIG